MRAGEFVSEAVKPLKPKTPAQARLNQLKQQTKQTQQQVKRERAQQQLKRAKQAVANANQLTESTAMRTYNVIVSLDGVTCNTTVDADGQVQAWKLAQHLYGKTNVRSVY